jgi:ParB-like chromosome segregation protein Spo0J
MQIIDKKIGEIKPYEKNPRKNDNAVDAVASSISQFGFKNPIVIDGNNIIICGHTRYKAAQKLGLDVVPCVVADDLTDEQIKAYRLADNKVAELAEWDIDLLGEELDGIFDIDMSDFGFDLSDEKPPEREDLSDKVGETYEVIIECVNELEQEQIYNKLIGDGYSCRLSTL